MLARFARRLAASPSSAEVEIYRLGNIIRSQDERVLITAAAAIAASGSIALCATAPTTSPRRRSWPAIEDVMVPAWSAGAASGPRTNGAAATAATLCPLAALTTQDICVTASKMHLFVTQVDSVST